MDWIVDVGKLFLGGLILFISLDLCRGMLRLQHKYGLSLGVEDWVEWKDWFIFYLPRQTARIRWYIIFWLIGFAAVFIPFWFLEKIY